MIFVNRKVITYFCSPETKKFPPILPLKVKPIPISKIKAKLDLKNPETFPTAQDLIDTYVSDSRTNKTKSFEANLLWELMFQHSNISSLKLFIKHDQNLLSIFENPRDILLFPNYRLRNLEDILIFFYSDNHWNILLQHIKPLELFKIIDTQSSLSILDIFTDPKSWKTLTTLYGFSTKQILQIATIKGAYKTLKKILDTDCWETLTKAYKLDLSQIFKIIKHGGSSNVLTLLLDEKNWEKLTQVYNLEVDDILKIANHTGSLNVFKILLDPNNWRILTKVYKLKKGDIVKISNHIGSRQVLDLLLIDENWEKLTEVYRLNLDNIIEIANHGSASSILTLLLDSKKWEILTNVYHLETNDIVKIANNIGSKLTFEILLTPQHWHTLTEVYKLPLHSIVKISSTNGSRNTLETLLIPKHWHTLTNVYGLDTHSITRISSNNGARNVFSILLNPDHWHRLTNVYRFNLQNIIDIASHYGARKTLNVLLNPNHWFRLTETYKMTIDDIAKICNHHGSSATLELLLKPKIWKTLTEIYCLDLNGIIKISNQEDSENIFTILLTKKNWQLLLNNYNFNASDIVKITSHKESKKTLNLLLFKQNWQILRKSFNLPPHILATILDKNYAYNTLKTLLNPQSFHQLCSTFNKEMIIKLTESTHRSPSQLKSFIHKQERFSYFFKKEFMETIIHLPKKDQNGLYETCLSPLRKSLHFSEREHLILAKISGNHLPHIFNLIHSQTDVIASLFSENGLPVIDLSKPPIYFSLENLTEIDYWTITLVELHHYCFVDPLFLEDLDFLTSAIPTTQLSDTERLARLKRLTYFSSQASRSDRLIIWKQALQRDWIQSNIWVHRLEALSYPLKKWFLLNGYTIIQHLFNPPPLEHPFDISLQDQNNLMHCLQQAPLRCYIQETFSTTLESSPSWFPTKYTLQSTSTNESQLSTESPFHLTFVDWMRLIIKLYTLIDKEMTVLNSLNDISLWPESMIFSPHEIASYQEKYPTIYIHKNTLHTSLSLEQLKAILYAPIEPYSASSDTTRQPYPHRSTDYLFNETSLFLELFLLNDSEWKKRIYVGETDEEIS